MKLVLGLRGIYTVFLAEMKRSSEADSASCYRELSDDFVCVFLNGVGIVQLI